MTRPRASEDRSRPRPAGVRLGLAAGLTLLGTFLLFRTLYAPTPLLYGTDAYYHLATARVFAAEGVPSDLPWARFSVLGPGFGDKELLFHWLLAPFAAGRDPAAGGRLALALLDALILAALAPVAVRALGWWGLVVPFWLPLAATEFTWRLVRLRPELLSLLLLMAAVWAVGRQRYRLLGALAAVYALSYTAFHAFVGLCVVWFAFRAWARRKTDWALLLYPLLGTGLGLLLHPNFPANLRVWAVQSVAFFRFKAILDVGTEIRPQTTAAVVALYAGWALGLWILWRSAPARRSLPATDPAALDAAALAATIFGLLYLQMSRFALYFVPFATLALLLALIRLRLRPGFWMALPWRGRVPVAVAAALCLAVSVPQARSQLRRFRLRTASGPRNARLVDREAFAAAVPPEARIAAPWRSTHLYLFHAPQGRYLNVLDPVFMAVPFPELYEVQRALFDGKVPDVPLVTGTLLDSRFLAYSTSTESPDLTRRLLGDPRVRPLHRGINALFEILPGANRGFVLDWRAAPGSEAAPPPTARPGPPYPRASDPSAAALEGYVDARRVAPSGCVTFSRQLTVTDTEEREYELAPWGRATLWLDGGRRLEIGAGARAILGQGARFRLRLSPGAHRLAVVSCPAEGDSGPSGFYLLARGAEPTSGAAAAGST